jgi:hypothetical protein
MDIEKIFENYTQLENTFLDKLINNNKNILSTLQTINTEMGIRELKKNEEECKEREAKLEHIRNSKKHSTNPRSRQKINKMLKNNGRKEISNFLHWNVTTNKNNRHGTVYELILPVIENALKVGGHAATDVITIDIGSIDLNIDLKDAFTQETENIRKVIEE